MERGERLVMSGRDSMNVVYQLPVRGLYDPYPGYYHRERGKNSSTPQYRIISPFSYLFFSYLGYTLLLHSPGGS